MTEPKSQEPKVITVPPYTRKDGTKVSGYSYTRYSGILAGARGSPKKERMNGYCHYNDG